MENSVRLCKSEIFSIVFYVPSLLSLCSVTLIMIDRYISELAEGCFWVGGILISRGGTPPDGGAAAGAGVDSCLVEFCPEETSGGNGFRAVHGASCSCRPGESNDCDCAEGILL